MLKEILDEYPEYYLDQFMHEFYTKSHIPVSLSLIYRCLHDQLNYRLLVVQEIVLKRNEEDMKLFKSAL